MAKGEERKMCMEMERRRTRKELGVEWTRSLGKGIDRRDASRIEGGEPGDEEENFPADAIYDEGQ